MIASRNSTLFFLVWSVFFRVVVWNFLRVATLLSDRARDQLKSRGSIKDDAVTLARRRRQYRDCVVFFCSSAGEYEQAKPLIDRLSKIDGMLCHVFFFSVSGAKFAKARQDDLSWSMSPPDTVWDWGTLFAALRPSRAIIVRHEMWPGFLFAAGMWCEIAIINGAVPSMFGRQHRAFDKANLFIKSLLLNMVDQVFVVAESDRAFYHKWFGVPIERIVVAGDTKYDRVMERALIKKSVVGLLRHRFQSEWNPPGCEILLIAGSVHLPDVEIILDALAGAQLVGVKALLVPHDVSSSNVAAIFDLCQRLGFSTELLSEADNSGFRFRGQHPRLLVVDEMGRLSDLYGCADFAWVGGAVHAKIHNVLEPAAWGLAIAAGEKFQNSPEAVAMSKAGLLVAASDGESLRRKWTAGLSSLKAMGQETRQFAENLTGAADLIMKELFRQPTRKGIT